MARARRTASAAADVADLVELSRLLVSIAYRSLDASSHTLSLRQFRALALLTRGGACTAGALASQLDMVPSTATRLCDKLVAAGWLNRETRPDNRREVEVSITVQGEQLVQDVLVRRATELEQILGRLPDASRQALAGVLPELIAAADATVDQARAAWAV